MFPTLIVNPIDLLASVSNIIYVYNYLLQGEIGSLREQLAGLNKDGSASDAPQGTYAYIHCNTKGLSCSINPW